MVEFITPRISPTVRQAGQVQSDTSSSLRRAAGATKQAADTFTDFYEKEAAIENDLLLATAQSDWAKTYDERKKSAGAGFAKGMLSDYDGYVEEVMRNSPERGRDGLKLAFDKYRIRLSDKALQREASARAAAKNKMVAEARRLKANALISDPSLLPEYREGASKEDDSLFVRSALSGMNEINPQQVHDDVKGGKYDAILTPAQKLSFMKTSKGKVDAEKRAVDAQIEAGKRRYENEIFAEEMDFVEVNGALPADSLMTNENIDFVSHGDTEWAKEVKRQRDVAVMNAETLNAVSMAGAAEITAMFEDQTARVKKPGNTGEDVAQLNALAKAVSERNTAITEDAAGYMAKADPNIQMQFDLYDSADPELKGDVAKNLTGYLDAQYNLTGVPQSLRTYMPKQMARQTVAMLNDVGNDAAPQVLSDLLDQWGDKSPEVTAQLRKEGLAPEFVVAMRHLDNPALAQDIANLRGLSAKDLKETVESITVKDIDVAVYAETRDYALAMQAGGGPEAVGIMNEQTDVMQRLSYARARGTNNPGTEIVSALMGEMFPETIIQSNIANVIVPVDVDAGVFEVMLEAGLEDKALADISVPDIPGLPADADRAVAVASLQSMGTWVTNGTSDGAVLMFDVTGRRIPVRNKDGSLYEIKFTDEIDPSLLNTGQSRIDISDAPLGAGLLDYGQYLQGSGQ